MSARAYIHICSISLTESAPRKRIDEQAQVYSWSCATSTDFFRDTWGCAESGERYGSCLRFSLYIEVSAKIAEEREY